MLAQRVELENCIFIIYNSNYFLLLDCLVSSDFCHLFDLIITIATSSYNIQNNAKNVVGSVTRSAFIAHNKCMSYSVPKVSSVEKQDIKDTPSPKMAFLILFFIHLLGYYTPLN